MPVQKTTPPTTTPLVALESPVSVYVYGILSASIFFTKMYKFSPYFKNTIYNLDIKKRG